MQAPVNHFAYEYARKMLEKLWNWLRNRSDDATTPPARVDLRKTGVRPVARPPRARKPANRARDDRRQHFLTEDETVSQGIESLGPGKNVLIRNKYVREDTGTHETLKILDDSVVESNDEEGIDPYNTGGFDRSRNWDRRFR